MKFQEIEYNQKRRKPEIVLSLSNTIRFTPALIEKFGLEGTKRVRIFTEERGSSFGIAFMFIDDENAKGLKFSPSGKGAFISGNSLFSSLKLTPKEMKERKISRRYFPQEIDEGGKRMLLIEINMEKELIKL